MRGGRRLAHRGLLIYHLPVEPATPSVSSPEGGQDWRFSLRKGRPLPSLATDPCLSVPSPMCTGSRDHLYHSLHRSSEKDP